MSKSQYTHLTEYISKVQKEIYINENVHTMTINKINTDDSDYYTTNKIKILYGEGTNDPYTEENPYIYTPINPPFLIYTDPSGDHPLCLATSTKVSLIPGKPMYFNFEKLCVTHIGIEDRTLQIQEVCTILTNGDADYILQIIMNLGSGCTVFLKLNKDQQSWNTSIHITQQEKPDINWTSIVKDIKIRYSDYSKFPSYFDNDGVLYLNKQHELPVRLFDPPNKYLYLDISNQQIVQNSTDENTQIRINNIKWVNESDGVYKLLLRVYYKNKEDLITFTYFTNSKKPYWKWEITNGFLNEYEIINNNFNQMNNIHSPKTPWNIDMYGCTSNKNTKPFIIINNKAENIRFPTIYPDLSGFFKVPGYLSIDVSGFSKPFPLICDDIFKCNNKFLPKNVPNTICIKNNSSDPNPEYGKIAITTSDYFFSPNSKPLKILNQGEQVKLLFIPNKSYPKNWFVYL